MRSFWNRNKSVIISLGAIIVLFGVSLVLAMTMRRTLDELAQEFDLIENEESFDKAKELYYDRRTLLSVLLGDNDLDEIETLLEDLRVALEVEDEKEILSAKRSLLGYLDQRRQEFEYSIEEIL